VIIRWLKEYWFLVVFLFASGMAWAETTAKIQTIEDAVKSQSQVQQEIVHLKEGQAKLDDRTKLMLDEQKETQQLLRQMLLEQKRINK